jgi:hypothetical protein
MDMTSSKPLSDSGYWTLTASDGTVKSTTYLHDWTSWWATEVGTSTWTSSTIYTYPTTVKSSTATWTPICECKICRPPGDTSELIDIVCDLALRGFLSA